MVGSLSAHSTAPGACESDFGYERHRPEATLLYQLVETHLPELVACMEAQGNALPAFVMREFEAFLQCGRLEGGFLRVQCESCRHEKLVAFSCKRRGFCPSCGGRRMAETAAFLVDEVFPHQPVRQWVITFPFELRFLFAAHPETMGKVLGIVNRAVSSFIIKQSGLKLSHAKTGAVTLIQRFGSALNTNIVCAAPHTMLHVTHSDM